MSDDTKIPQPEVVMPVCPVSAFRMAPFIAIYRARYNGLLNAPRYAKSLKAVSQEFGDEPTIRAFESYCKETDVQWFSVDKFAERIGKYLPSKPTEQRFIKEGDML